MADVTPLYQQRDLSPLRVWPPRPSARTAVVLDHRDGYRLVTRESPIDPFEFIAGRFRQVFRVWLVPLQVEHESYQLPSSQLARPFRVDFNLTVLVTDPLTVVAEHRTDAWDAVEPVLRLQFRRIGRTLRPEELAAVEEQLSDLLTGLEVPEAGLQILRAGVTANLEGADLKRARERIEDEHRRLLDEQNSLFRGELERQEDQHRQKLEEVRLAHRYALDREREEHHHELESRRRAIYKQVMVDDRVLPGLLLLKLGARPAGGDAKDVDEVIEALKQARVDDVRVPFEVLARYLQVTERWQLEEPVGELIRRLLDRFEPRAVTGDDPPSS